MIGALVAVISLNMSLSLIQNGQVAGSFPVTSATTTTPIALTSPSHGVPLGRVVHGYVSGLDGMPEATGMWVCTPIDANTFVISGIDQQGNVIPVPGTGTYVSGGAIQFAFPDWGILLGRQMLALNSAPVSPRIVFVPTREPKWLEESAGGYDVPAPPQSRGSVEAQSLRLNKTIAQQLTTFEVYVTGAASPPSPNYGDFDATQSLVQLLYQTVFDAYTSGVATMLGGDWPSQKIDAASMLQRGQQWMGILQFKQKVSEAPLQFVPTGTTLTLVIEPENPLVPNDQTTIVVSPT
jgi:hypothetical protein